MRRFSLAILIIAAVLGAVSSCAKRESENTDLLEAKAFDAWMLKYVNAGVDNSVAVKQSDGIYVEVIADGKQDMDAPSDTIVWLRLEYTGRDLHDNVFVTRSEREALQQKTYTPKTHYISDYLFCGDQNHGSMVEGQYFALKQKELLKPDGSTIKMSEGTEVRLYIPSYLAFGSTGYTDDQGYGGQYALSKTKPVIEELRVAEIIKDPVVWEEGAVEDYAEDVWMLTAKDTIAANMYVDTVRFNQLLAAKYGREMSLPWEKEYDLTADSTAKIWFIARFLDGFILDTNIDTTYNRFYNRRAADGYYAESKTFSVLSYKVGDEEDKSNYIPAFYSAIPALRKGQWSRIVFTSNYGYGATGLSAALQAQQDYYDYYMSMMYSSYYGGYGYGGYGGGYGGYGSYGSYGSYNNPYNSYDYYNYSPSYSSSSSDETEIMTEVQPYTPLIFEIYIEADEEE